MTDKILNNTPNITYICAPPKSGKSYLVKYLLNELFKMKKLKYGIVFTGSKHNGDYNFLPQKYVYSKYDENVLKRFYNLQLKFKSKSKKKEAPPAFIIFDDMLGSLNFNTGFIIELICKYRHPNFTIISTSQYIKAIPPTIRRCTSYFIMFKTIGEDTIKAIQENFMPDKTKKQLIKYVDDSLPDVEERKFIFVDVLANIKDKYTIDRAPAEYKQIKINY